jgi:hypothetical protein
MAKRDMLRPALDESERRRAVLVLGMHRSGTSAMTRVLNLGGASLPTRLKPGSEDNPAGLWEGRLVVEKNEELMESLGSFWDDIAALPADWLQRESTRRQEDALVEILRDDVADAKTFAIKDPRASRLVPLWLRVLDRVGAAPGFVLMIRHPVEVARSLAVRNGFGEHKSFLLWLVHLVEAERDTRGHPRVFVHFEQLLRDPDAVLSRVRDTIGGSWTPSSESAVSEIQKFLSEDLRHHVAEEEIRDGPTELRTWIRDAYSVARRVAEDASADAAAQPEFDMLARHVRTAQLVVPVVSEARALAEVRVELAARTEQLERVKRKLARSEEKRADAVRRINEVERSLAWRLSRAVGSQRRSSAR